MIKIVKKSFSHTDKDSVQGGNLPTLADKLSDAGKLGKPLNSLSSAHGVQDPIVRLTGKAYKLLSGSEENLSVIEYDCKTLSAMALRHKYKSTEISHRKMRERAPKQERTVNPDWTKFRDFLRDMGPRPKDTTLDRIDNTDPEYGPGKCSWATRRVQNNNKGDTLVFVHSVTGAKWTASQLAKLQGRSLSAIEKRRSRSRWTDAEIIAGRRLPREGSQHCGGGSNRHPHRQRATPPTKPPSAAQLAFKQKRQRAEAHREEFGDEYCIASLEELNDAIAGCAGPVTREQYARKFASWWSSYKPHLVRKNLPEWAQKLISEIDPTP